MSNRSSARSPSTAVILAEGDGNVKPESEQTHSLLLFSHSLSMFPLVSLFFVPICRAGFQRFTAISADNDGLDDSINLLDAETKELTVVGEVGLVFVIVVVVWCCCYCCCFCRRLSFGGGTQWRIKPQ